MPLLHGQFYNTFHSQRLQTILAGESLINDAFALVLYRLAITALLTGKFSWPEATFDFFENSHRWNWRRNHRQLYDSDFASRFLPPIIGANVSFVIPYITYIAADRFGVPECLPW